MRNVETKAPPSQEPRDHRVQAARATFSQIHGYDPKASNDAVMWHLESRNKKVKRGVKADLRWNDKETTGAQGPLRVLSRVLCLLSALMWVLVLLQDIFVCRLR